MYTPEINERLTVSYYVREDAVMKNGYLQASYAVVSAEPDKWGIVHNECADHDGTDLVTVHVRDSQDIDKAWRLAQMILELIKAGNV